MKANLAKLLDRLAPMLRAPAAPVSRPLAHDGLTTQDDIRMCFRLLLDRAPNPEEWQGHSAQAGHPLRDVVAGYLNSLEFTRRGLLQPDPATAPELAQHDGFVIYADRADLQIGQHVLAGAYEPEVTAVFRRVLRPGMTVIDIGANIGFFSMLSAAAVGPSGAVLAIEPNPGNGRLLEASRRRNGFRHVTLAQVAAGRHLGLLVLNTTHSNGTTSEPNEDAAYLLQARTVPSMPVDLLAGAALKGRRIDLIKVDVEGAEYNALLGAEGILSSDRPRIVSEFSPNFMPGISGIDGPGYLGWLHGRGYSVAVIETDGSTTPYMQDAAGVMAAFARRNADHIDLLAEPTA